MRTGSMLFAGVVAAMIAGSSAIQGQEAQGAKPAQDSSKGKSVQLTGCLSKGPDAGSFTLSNATEASAAKDTAKAGETKSYQVMAKDASLALDKHVGHIVQITGTIDPSSMGAAKSSPGAPGATGTTGKAGDMPHVMATAMKHVAPACK